MGRTAVAFCPGHISGYFRAIFGETPAGTGSIGAGIVITEGVRASVTPAPSPSVEIFGKDSTLIARGSPPLDYVMQKLRVSAAVTTSCTLPIGAGFGLSAAALLATITALDDLFDFGMPGQEVAALAHEAEVIHRTGLGDVAACMGGGLVSRRGPGIGAHISRDLAIHDSLYAVSFGPLPTPEILSSPSALEKVRTAFPARCPRDILDFFRLSRGFADQSGLVTPEIARVLRACDHAAVPASMTMLGKGVFALGPDAEEVLSRFGTVYRFAVAGRGFQRGFP